MYYNTYLQYKFQQPALFELKKGNTNFCALVSKCIFHILEIIGRKKNTKTSISLFYL